MTGHTGLGLGLMGGILCVALAPACDASLEAVPEGALALVGDTVIWPEELEQTRVQLGAYGQRRFGQEGGKMALLEAAIIQRLLELEARRLGMGEDARMQWAVNEELARLQLAAELERRVPEQGVAEDLTALRAYYDAHLVDFALPEERSADLIEVETADKAETLIAELSAGSVLWEDAWVGDHTPSQTSDVERFPLFHLHLFREGLKVGDVVPVPIYTSSKTHVARVREIQLPSFRPFEGPRVQAELIDAVRAPLLAKARAELMAELAERYPVTRP